jgi:hypothetical protein
MTTCYACDALATSREHVPPRLLFPESKDTDDDRDLRRNLITVQSCDTHNSFKSKDDEYLLWVLSINADANGFGFQQATTKGDRSYKRRPALLNSILDTERLFPGRDPEADVDTERFDRSMELIARGLYFHHVGRRWAGSVLVIDGFTDFLDAPSVVKTGFSTLLQVAERAVASEPQHGANPEVFWHKIHLRSGSPHCVQKFTFYDGCSVFAILGWS